MRNYSRVVSRFTETKQKPVPLLAKQTQMNPNPRQNERTGNSSKKPCQIKHTIFSKNPNGRSLYTRIEVNKYLRPFVEDLLEFMQ